MEITNTNKKYKTSDRLTYSCQYHVIFCPKYRRKVLLSPIDERLKEIAHDVAKEYQFEILDMEVMPDHVHLLIDCNPRIGIAKCVKEVKGRTSHVLREEFPELKRKLPTLWTRSSLISSCGTVSLETVMKYIENQKNV